MGSKKSGKSSLTGVLVFLFISVAMLVTNPSQDDFTGFLKKKTTREAKQKNDFAGAVMEAFSGPASWIAGNVAERKNFIFFSWYTIPVMDKDYHYIGIFKTFIAL